MLISVLKINIAAKRKECWESSCFIKTCQKYFIGKLIFESIEALTCKVSKTISEGSMLETKEKVKASQHQHTQ